MYAITIHLDTLFIYSKPYSSKPSFVPVHVGTVFRVNVWRDCQLDGT